MEYMLTFFQAIILGIVEGVTEFLPISSTAHLILASDLLRIAQTDFQKSFEIIIQLGSILAVLVLYWRSFLKYEVLKRVIIGFIPTGIIGLIFYKIVKTYLLGNTAVVLWALFLGGVFLVVFEWLRPEPSRSARQDVTTMTPGQCVIIGLCQAVSIIPGVSRSAATIVGGLMLGLRRETIVEYSFLLAVPTMIAATGLDVVKNYHQLLSGSIALLLTGFVISFVVALASIRWLLQYIRQHDFTGFGVYRIIVAIVFFFVHVG